MENDLGPIQRCNNCFCYGSSKGPTQQGVQRSPFGSQVLFGHKDTFILHYLRELKIPYHLTLDYFLTCGQSFIIHSFILLTKGTTQVSHHYRHKHGYDKRGYCAKTANSACGFEPEWLNTVRFFTEAELFVCMDECMCLCAWMYAHTWAFLQLECTVDPNKWSRQLIRRAVSSNNTFCNIDHKRKDTVLEFTHAYLKQF